MESSLDDGIYFVQNGIYLESIFGGRMLLGIYFWLTESTLESTFGGIYFVQNGIYFWWMESTLDQNGIYFWWMESTVLIWDLSSFGKSTLDSTWNLLEST